MRNWSYLMLGVADAHVLMCFLLHIFFIYIKL
nr:MAG TPA: hypothetical protein [Caudoviricetes sp.]